MRPRGGEHLTTAGWPASIAAGLKLKQMQGQADALNAELKQRDSDAAFDLHLRVVMARRALVRSQTSAGSRRPAPPSRRSRRQSMRSAGRAKIPMHRKLRYLRVKHSQTDFFWIFHSRP